MQAKPGPARTFWALGILIGVMGSALGTDAGAAGAAPQPAERASGSATDVKEDAPTKPPNRLYVSRGVRSRFCFGAGVHVGVNSLKNIKSPLLSGFSVHFRMSGIAGLSIEYDFNRVAKTPTAAEALKVESLHFIPNLRIAAVIYPYRWRMLAPYAFGGLGIDTASTEDRAAFQLGLGLEVTFWHDRFAVLAEFRAFLPRPSDVEKHKERLEITGAYDTPKTAEYYNVKNLLFTLSARFYY